MAPDEDTQEEPKRPLGMSNSAWNLYQLGYEPPETHWAWTREHERQP
jgi:hypothetical protein